MRRTHITYLMDAAENYAGGPPFGRSSKRKKHKKLKVILAVTLLIIILLVFLVFRNVTNILFSISDATIRSIAALAANDAVNRTLSDGPGYDELVLITRDDRNNVTSIILNPLKINTIAREAAYLTQRYETERSAAGIYVPLGAFTGIETFAGFGPRVNVKIIPICSVEARFLSKFEQAGINQTKHSLYIDLVSDVSIVMPSETRRLTTSAQVLICESIIYGKIPEVYLQGGLGGMNAALVPNN